MKQCSKCKRKKRSSAFSPWKKSKDGLFSWCKRCNADAQKARRDRYVAEHGRGPKTSRNPETLKKQRQRHYRKHRERLLAEQGGRSHGITPEEYVERRSRSCEICGEYRPPKKAGTGMHLDHDHKTGKLRGTLCELCNRGLGNFKDNPALLKEAAAYLAKYL